MLGKLGWIQVPNEVQGSRKSYMIHFIRFKSTAVEPSSWHSKNEEMTVALVPPSMDGNDTKKTCIPCLRRTKR